jgi:hypothetical protein
MSRPTAAIISAVRASYSPGRRGSQSWYPAWATEQLLAIEDAARPIRQASDQALAQAREDAVLTNEKFNAR